MAVANTKSSIVTNGDATPAVTTTSFINEGVLKEQVGYVEVLAADDDTSVYRMCRVPSNARISELSVKNDAITNGTDYELGVYQTADNGSAVVDSDVLASLIDMSSARNQFAPVDTIIEEDSEKRLWELLGLSQDSHRQYDIALTGQTVGTAAGTIALRLRYAQ